MNTTLLITLALWTFLGPVVLFFVASFNAAFGDASNLTRRQILAYGPGVWALAFYLSRQTKGTK